MAKLTDFQLLENVLIYLARIEYYSKDLKQSNLNKNFKAQDAILYCIQQFGKCVNNISEEFKRQHQQIHMLDWHLFGGFAIDDYFSEDDLFEVIDSLLSNLDKIEKIYLKERNKLVDKSESKIPERYYKSNKSKDLPLDMHYKYPIHSHTSVWTVKKR